VPGRTYHASLKLETLNDGMILPVHPELRVNRIEGVVGRVGDPDSFPELSFDYDVVLALPTRPDIEEVGVDGAHDFPGPFVPLHHGTDRLSAAKGIVRSHGANDDSGLPEIDLENVDVPGPAIHDYASMHYTWGHSARG
jgi:hypothetical protein